MSRLQTATLDKLRSPKHDEGELRELEQALQKAYDRVLKAHVRRRLKRGSQREVTCRYDGDPPSYIEEQGGHNRTQRGTTEIKDIYGATFPSRAAKALCESKVRSTLS